MRSDGRANQTKRTVASLNDLQTYPKINMQTKGEILPNMPTFLHSYVRPLSH